MQLYISIKSRAVRPTNLGRMFNKDKFYKKRFQEVNDVWVNDVYFNQDNLKKKIN